MENHWDELLHDPTQYPVDALTHPESIGALQTFDFDLGSGLWGHQARKADPLSVLGSIGTIPPFNPWSAKSGDSSPMLSDDYGYSTDELRRPSRSTASSEGTISPKDAVFISSDHPEAVGYFSPSISTFYNSPNSYQDTPGPISPISPRPQAVRPIARLNSDADVKPTLDGGEIPRAAAAGSRRRSAKVTPTTTATTKSSGLSNNNNSKPMTARDRKRRQMHNASAMRSRIRLNETLDKMWKTIPAARRRRRQLSINSDGAEPHHDTMDDADEDEEERIGRADKVEVGIEYILYLEERVRELEAQVA